MREDSSQVLPEVHMRSRDPVSRCELRDFSATKRPYLKLVRSGLC